jgi:hypothetical protein
MAWKAKFFDEQNIDDMVKWIKTLRMFHSLEVVYKQFPRGSLAAEMMLPVLDGLRVSNNHESFLLHPGDFILIHEEEMPPLHCGLWVEEVSERDFKQNYQILQETNDELLVTRQYQWNIMSHHQADRRRQEAAEYARLNDNRNDDTR